MVGVYFCQCHSSIFVYSIWQIQGRQPTSHYKTSGDILITCSGGGIVEIVKYFSLCFRLLFSAMI